MNILVCIKQVPGSNKVEVDPVTGVLKRNSADAKLNPYDFMHWKQGCACASSMAVRWMC